MRIQFKIFLALLAILMTAPALGQTASEEQKEESTPLRVTIRPMPKFRFGDFFSYRSAEPAPRVEELFLCPPGTLFGCEVFQPLPQEQGDPFTIRLNRVVAAYVYQKYRDQFGRPDTGLIMGKRYYGLPRYVILASLGIDPKLPEEGGLNNGIYGSLYHADTLSLGDRIGGPIILAKGGPSQIELLGGNRKHFSGN